MKNIIFIAPPAAGKGTQSDLLVKKYHYYHISTGDLLRKEIDNKTKVGKEIAKIMQAGGLVNDDIVTDLLKKTIETLDRPFILDGYPRNKEQAKVIDELLSNLGKTAELVVYLNIDEAEATRRAVGRQICPKCARTYHQEDEIVKPKVAGICDDCSEELITREDDTKEAFKIRFKNYLDNTAPLLEFYENRQQLVNIAVKTTPEATFAEIEKVIK